MRLSQMPTSASSQAQNPLTRKTHLMIDEAEEQRVKLVHEYYGVNTDTEPPAYDTRTRKALLREHEHITRQIHHSLDMRERIEDHTFFAALLTFVLAVLTLTSMMGEQNWLSLSVLGMGWAFCGVSVGKLIRERRYHQRRLIDLWDRDNKIKDIIWS